MRSPVTLGDVAGLFFFDFVLYLMIARLDLQIPIIPRK